LTAFTTAKWEYSGNFVTQQTWLWWRLKRLSYIHSMAFISYLAATDHN